MAVRNLLIRGGADFSGMYQGLNQAQKRMSSFQRSVNAIMSKMAATFATIRVGETIKNGVQDAMSVETSIENLNRTMQNSAKSFQDWVNAQSQAYGMSTQEAYKYGSTFSNLISSFQSDTSQITDNTQELMKATSIIASKTGRTFEDTAERIRSGMLGSTEAIEDLGVYTQVSMLESTQAFQQFANGKSWQQLDFQTQQQIRLMAILEQTYARYGDTLADTTQTRHNQFIASLKNVQLALGQAFLPIYNAILPPLTALMNALAKAIGYIAAFTTALFGKAKIGKQQAKTTTELGSSIGNLGNSASSAGDSLNKASKATKKAGTAAKKAKKEIGGLIGGLDEINNLSVSETAGTSGSSGSSSTPSAGSVSTPTVSGLGDIGTIDMGSTIDTSGLDGKVAKIKATFDKIRKIISDNKDLIISLMAGLMAGLGVVMIAKWGKIGAFFAKNFPLLTTIFSKLGKVILKPFSLIKQAITALLGLNPIVLAIVIVITTLVASLTYLWRTNKDFRDNVIKTWKMIKDALQPWIEGLGIILKVLADIVLTVLGAAFKFLGKIILKVVEVFAGDLMSDLQKSAPTIKKAGEAFKKFAKNVEKVWKQIKKFSLKKWIEDKKKEINDGFDRIGKDFENIGKEIEKDWEDAKKSVDEFVIDVKSKIEDFKKKVEDKWNETKSWIKNKSFDIKSKVEDFKKIVENKWESTKSWIKNKALDVSAKISDFKKSVQDKWNETKNWIKDKALDIKSKVEDFKSKASDKLSEAEIWIKGKLLEVKTKVESFYDKAKENFDIAKSNAKSWILELGVKVGSFYQKAVESYNIAKSNIQSWVFNVGVSVSSFYSKAVESYNIAKNSIKNWLFSIGVSVGSFYSKAVESYNIAKNNIKSWLLSIGVSIGSFYSKAVESYNSAKNSIKSWVFSVGVSVGSFYSKLTSAYNSAKNSIKSWSFSVALKVTSSASAIKSAVNDLIRSINNNVLGKIKIKLPGILGGGTFTAPKIPYLAKGGIVDSATLAVVGEQGREAVMPLENNTGWITDLAGKISSRMGDGGYSTPTNNRPQEVYNGDVVIKLDGNTVLRQSVISILRQMKRQGITI